MWRLCMLLVLVGAGCNNNKVVGPFEHRRPERVDDPLLTTTEQERRGRDRLALPDESPKVGPLSGIEGVPDVRGVRPN